MWDRLLTNCNLATMDPAVSGAFGIIEDGAIGIQDGRIVRVGRRIDLAGFRAARVEPLGGAWVTPGLIDCHTHLVFGGDRAGEFEQRLHGATYEELAQAGGGIVSTVVIPPAIRPLRRGRAWAMSSSLEASRVALTVATMPPPASAISS